MKGRILVTGGAGFIGSHLVDRLESQGYAVVILDALSFGADIRNLGHTVQIVGGVGRQRISELPDASRVLVVGDVSDQDLVFDLVSKTEGCFHLAAQTHVDRSYGDVRPFVDSNVVGSYAVLEAFRRSSGGKKLVFMSTDEVYGDKESGFSGEEDPLAPRNIYSALKAGGDILARTYSSIYGIHVVIARPANNYGPRQFEEKLIPRAVTTILRGGKIPVFGDGRQIRDWLYVDDTTTALMKLYHDGRPGQAYNLGSHQFKTVREVIWDIAYLMGVDPENHVDHVADRICGDRRYALDLSKMGHELGWMAATSFTGGLEKTVSWYKSHYDARGVKRW